MDWQNLLTWIAVSLAGVFVTWSGWRTWRSLKVGCSGGCGCAKTDDAKAPALIAPEQVKLRQRPQAQG